MQQKAEDDQFQAILDGHLKIEELLNDKKRLRSMLADSDDDNESRSASELIGLIRNNYS